MPDKPHLHGLPAIMAGFLASPTGQQMVRNFLSSAEGQQAVDSFLSSADGERMIYGYLSSPEGKGTIEAVLANPHGQRMAFLLLAQSLDTLELPEEVKTIIRRAMAEHERQVASA